MPNIQPADKTQDIIDEINLYLSDSVKLDGFKAAQIKRSISQLPEQRNKEMTMSLFYVASQDYQSFYESFLSYKRRLQLVDVSEYLSYAFMLRVIGKMSESYDLLEEGNAKLGYTSPLILSALLSQSVIGLDVTAYKQHVQGLKKLKAVDNISKSELQVCEKESATLEQWVERDLITEEQLSEFASIIFNITMRFSLHIRANIIDINDHDDWLSVSYVLCENSTSQSKLFEINDCLFDELIKNKLDDVSAVFQFIRLPNGRVREIREALVNGG